MTLAYALSKTGHPNCRRPDKVIDARQSACLYVSLGIFSFIWASGLNDHSMFVRDVKRTNLCCPAKKRDPFLWLIAVDCYLFAPALSAAAGGPSIPG